MKLSFRVNLNIDQVFDYLTDMQKFVSVHPVISRIDTTGNETYLVHETLKMGFIPFSFTYPVTIEKSAVDKTVTIRAIVFKLTRVEMKFVLSQENNYTLIDEEISFRSPLPVIRVMQGIFREQHEQFFKNLEIKTLEWLSSS